MVKLNSQDLKTITKICLTSHLDIKFHKLSFDCFALKLFSSKANSFDIIFHRVTCRFPKIHERYLQLSSSYIFP